MKTRRVIQALRDGLPRKSRPGWWLRFYILECGCIYYRRVLRDGELDELVGLYRDAARGECGVCLEAPEKWEERVLEDVGVHRVRVEVE